MKGVQIDPPLEKATLKKPSLIRVNDCFRQLLLLQTNILVPIKITPSPTINQTLNFSFPGIFKKVIFWFSTLFCQYPFA